MGARNDSPPAVTVDARSFAWTGDARGVLTTRTAAIEAREVATTDAGARCARVEGATAADARRRRCAPRTFICSGAFENLEAWTRRTRARATRTRPADGRREGEAEAFREASDGRPHRGHACARDVRPRRRAVPPDTTKTSPPAGVWRGHQPRRRRSAARSVRGEIDTLPGADRPPRRARPIFNLTVEFDRRATPTAVNFQPFRITFVGDAFQACVTRGEPRNLELRRAGRVVREVTVRSRPLGVRGSRRSPARPERAHHHRPRGALSLVAPQFTWADFHLLLLLLHFLRGEILEPAPSLE